MVACSNNKQAKSKKGHLFRTIAHEVFVRLKNRFRVFLFKQLLFYQAAKQANNLQSSKLLLTVANGLKLLRPMTAIFRYQLSIWSFSASSSLFAKQKSNLKRMWTWNAEQASNHLPRMMLKRANAVHLHVLALVLLLVLFALLSIGSQANDDFLN